MKLNNPELLRSQCLINGEWCDALSGKREAVINPATGAELASIPLVSEEETQQAIAAAQRAQNDWKQLTAKQRSALLLAWADKVLAAQEDLAQLMTAEQGKSLADRHRVGDEGAAAGARRHVAFRQQLFING